MGRPAQTRTWVMQGPPHSPGPGSCGDSHPCYRVCKVCKALCGDCNILGPSGNMPIVLIHRDTLSYGQANCDGLREELDAVRFRRLLEAG